MEIKIEINHLYSWYRHSTKEWCVFFSYATNNTNVTINFPNKKLNKAKKNFIKYITSGFCGDEMLYLIRTNQIKIEKTRG